MAAKVSAAVACRTGACWAGACWAVWGFWAGLFALFWAWAAGTARVSRTAAGMMVLGSLMLCLLQDAPKGVLEVFTKGEAFSSIEPHHAHRPPAEASPLSPLPSPSHRPGEGDSAEAVVLVGGVIGLIGRIGRIGRMAFFKPPPIVLLCQIARPAPPGHECPGYASTEKPGEPGSWRSDSDFGAGFSRLFVGYVARAFMPGRAGVCAQAAR